MGVKENRREWIMEEDNQWMNGMHCEEFDG